MGLRHAFGLGSVCVRSIRVFMATAPARGEPMLQAVFGDLSYFTFAPTTLSHWPVIAVLAEFCSSRLGNTAFS